MARLLDLLSPDDLRAARNLQLIARGVVEGVMAGLHRSPHKGNSIEFKQHRPYVRGDDLRTLDWKLFGKTDRFYVREYEEETNLRATLLLDCSGSMAYGADSTGTKRRRDVETKGAGHGQHSVSSSLRLSVSSLSKHDYAVRLAACLGHLLLRQQDAVGLISFDSAVGRFVPARSGPRHLGIILRELVQTRPGGETDLGRVFAELAPKLVHHHRRGLIILISDCFGDVEALARGLAHFKHARHEVIVFQVWHRDELEFPFDGRLRFDDLEATGSRRELDARYLRRQYLEKLAAFRSSVTGVCARHRVDLVEAVTDQPPGTVLTDYLVRRRRGPVVAADGEGVRR